MGLSMLRKKKVDAKKKKKENLKKKRNASPKSYKDRNSNDVFETLRTSPSRKSKTVVEDTESMIDNAWEEELSSLNSSQEFSDCCRWIISYEMLCAKCKRAKDYSEEIQNVNKKAQKLLKPTSPRHEFFA